MVREIFNELIREAKDGKVIIDDDSWPVSFNTTIINGKDNLIYRNERNLSELIVKNEEVFLSLLEEYVYLELSLSRKTLSFVKDKERNRVKWILAYLFINATTEDFVNPIQYLRRRIVFLRDTTFSYLNNGVDLEISGHFFDSRINIQNTMSSVSMETPYSIDISLVNNINGQNVSYPLASIYYGICEENGEKVCYIYSLMKPKNSIADTDENKLYVKKIGRYLYKLNNGIEDYETDEYIKYKNRESNYYPEGNITDVTPSFLLSLNVFIALLQKEEIQKLKVVPYLPLRYLSREITADNIEDDDRRNQLKARNNNIQNNATNKFIRTFLRMMVHSTDIELTSYPYEGTECLEMLVKDKENIIDNPILEDVALAVYNLGERKENNYHL